jgi:hypothetical protein
MTPESHAGHLTSMEGRGQVVQSSESLADRIFPPPGEAGLGFLADLATTQFNALGEQG